MEEGREIQGNIARLQANAQLESFAVGIRNTSLYILPILLAAMASRSTSVNKDQLIISLLYCVVLFFQKER